MILSSCLDTITLEDHVKQLNDNCPIDLGGGFVLYGYVIEDINVITEIGINESFVASNFIEVHGVEKSKAGFLTNLDDGTKDLFKLMSQEGKGLIIRFIGESEENTAELTYTAEEIKTFVKNYL